MCPITANSDEVPRFRPYVPCEIAIEMIVLITHHLIRKYIRSTIFRLHGEIHVSVFYKKQSFYLQNASIFGFL